MAVGADSEIDAETLVRGRNPPSKKAVTARINDSLVLLIISVILQESRPSRKAQPCNALIPPLNLFDSSHIDVFDTAKYALAHERAWVCTAFLRSSTSSVPPFSEKLVNLVNLDSWYLQFA